MKEKSGYLKCKALAEVVTEVQIELRAFMSAIC